MATHFPAGDIVETCLHNFAKEKNFFFDAGLHIVRGLSRLFTPVRDMPCFECASDVQPLLSQRIEEILEDAYLLEASRLRQFIGLNSNLASVKRDLRKLLTYIVRRRPWAKGLIKVTETLSAIPVNVGAVADKLVEAIPAASAASQGGVVLFQFSSFSKRLGLSGPLLVHRSLGSYVTRLPDA